MGLRTRVTDAWQRLTAIDAAAGDATKGERKTAMLPSILSPYSQGRIGQNATPKPTPANLRKFAETPVARRAINVVKDKIASMDWKIKLRRGYSNCSEAPDEARRLYAAENNSIARIVLKFDHEGMRVRRCDQRRCSLP